MISTVSKALSDAAPDSAPFVDHVGAEIGFDTNLNELHVGLAEDAGAGGVFPLDNRGVTTVLEDTTATQDGTREGGVWTSGGGGVPHAIDGPGITSTTYLSTGSTTAPTIPHNAAWDFDKAVPFTISFFSRSTTSSRAILRKSDGTSRLYIRFIDISGTDYLQVTLNGATETVTANFELTSLSGWTHFAVVWTSVAEDYTDIKLYEDGVELVQDSGSGSFSTEDFTTASDILLGYNGASTSSITLSHLSFFLSQLSEEIIGGLAKQDFNPLGSVVFTETFAKAVEVVAIGQIAVSGRSRGLVAGKELGLECYYSTNGTSYTEFSPNVPLPSTVAVAAGGTFYVKYTFVWDETFITEPSYDTPYLKTLGPTIFYDDLVVLPHRRLFPINEKAENWT